MTRHVWIGATALVLVLALPLGAETRRAGQPAAKAAAKPAAQEKAAAQPSGARPAAQPAAAPRASAPAQPGASRPATPATSLAESNSYRAEGRRDPFMSLLNRGSDPRTRKAEGLAGVLAGDAVLKGILQSRGMFLAIVQGPDTKRPFIVHANDRFADGVVKAITVDSILILQEVNDPLSLTKQREIRKTLRVVEEVK